MVFTLILDMIKSCIHISNLIMYDSNYINICTIQLDLNAFHRRLLCYDIDTGMCLSVCYGK